MAKQKWYVVRKGKETGIFTSRDECKARVNGFAGAQYKSYESQIEAEKAFSGHYGDAVKMKKGKEGERRVKKDFYKQVVEHNSICVDAACSSNPGVLEWQCVETISGKNLFASTQYPLGTTNVGEWLALVQGMRFLVENQRKERIIYSDSRIALGWVSKGIIKTTLPRTTETAKLREVVDRELERLRGVGIDFLKNKTIVLLKWKTKEWGEIPADYGRK